MEFYNRSGQNPSAVQLPPYMTKQEYLYSNVGNPNPLDAPRIKFRARDYWLEGRSARHEKCYEDESKALRCSKFWGVSQCKGRGSFLSFYSENNTSDRKRWVHESTAYIGTFKHEVDAARAHDLATLAITQTTLRTNFAVSDYKEDLKIMRSMNKTDCLDYIRRKLRYIPGGNATGFRGVLMAPQYSNRWPAILGRGAARDNMHIGTFDTDVDAARAYDVAAILLKGPKSYTNFQKEDYDEIGILEILRSNSSSFNVEVLNILERRWMEHFGDQEKRSSDTAKGSSIVDLPVNCSEFFQQCRQIDSSPNVAAFAVDSNVSNVIMHTNMGTMLTKVTSYDFSSLMTNDKNAIYGESRNAMSMPSQLVQTVASQVSNLYAAIENQWNVKLPRYHDLNQLVHESNEHPAGLLSFHELQNPTYFEGHQNLTSLQGYQYPELYDGDCTGSNEPLGFNADLQGTTGSGPKGNGKSPLNFLMYESPSIMELETRPPLLNAMFQIGSNFNQLDLYQSQAFFPSKFSNNAEEPVHEANPTMRYHFDNQFETNASQPVGDSWFLDACQHVVEVDPNVTYHLGNLVETEPSEFLSNSVFQKTARIMDVDEVLATMETDKGFNGAASVGNCIETDEGSNQKDLAAASAAANEDLTDDSTFMDDPGFSKWLGPEKILP